MSEIRGFARFGNKACVKTSSSPSLSAKTDMGGCLRPTVKMVNTVPPFTCKLYFVHLDVDPHSHEDIVILSLGVSPLATKHRSPSSSPSSALLKPKPFQQGCRRKRKMLHQTLLGLDSGLDIDAVT